MTLRLLFFSAMAAAAAWGNSEPGEPHGPNILPVPMVKALQSAIPDSALVETNTLYEGARHTTEQHRQTLVTNGWTFCPVDIMDADIVALDQACLDLLDRLPAEEKRDLQERISTREGERRLEYGEEMGLGSRSYELVEIK